MRTIHNTARVMTAGPYMKIFTPAELGITGPCSPDCEVCAQVTEWAPALADSYSPTYNPPAVPSILTKGNSMHQTIYRAGPPDDDSNPGPDTGGGQNPPPKPPGG